MSDEQAELLLVRFKFFVRGTFISLAILASLLIFDALVWKAGIAAFSALVAHQLRIGWRRIEQLAVLALAVALLQWLGMIPIKRWASSAIAIIDRFLG